MSSSRSWTIYLAQDKHLDYGWCGTETEVESRMAALVDGYLALAEAGRARWNLDCSLWLDAYRRQRGDQGAARLLNAIGQGLIGYGGQYNVMLWGLMGPELAVRALRGGREIESATGRPATVALVMENAGMPWGVANILAACGVRRLARGIFGLRAESYLHERAPYPLFWWVAPDGSRLLVHWPPYDSTRTWGGYAEASELLRLAGEGWDAFHTLHTGDRNTEEVYAARVAYIAATVARYEALGPNYPVSSILLLGTGWDNWTVTEDISRFIERYNAREPQGIRLVDARYDEFFDAIEAEVGERELVLPTFRGSYGICWEEWGAHVAGQLADLRRAERLVARAEARGALASIHAANEAPARPRAQRLNGGPIWEATRALLRFVEHDMGGCDLSTAAISVGDRAASTTRALDIATELGGSAAERKERQRSGASWRSLADREALVRIPWCGGQAAVDPRRCAVVELVDGAGQTWLPPCNGAAPGLGEFISTHYAGEGPFRQVLPPTLPAEPDPMVDLVLRRDDDSGCELRIEGRRWGIAYTAWWHLHSEADLLDVTYHLRGGWDGAPQSVQVAFPLALDAPRYRYDSVGAILTAGRQSAGGDDLPGANPVLYALHTFAAAHQEAGAVPRGAVLVSPDAPLVLWGEVASPIVGPLPAGIVSMPMMNLTRNDHQFYQGGRSEWTFRYRLALERGAFDPLRALAYAQGAGDPPFLWLPGATPLNPAVEVLEIAFPGGPLLACKAADDGRGLVLRFWNVLDAPCRGSLRLPDGLTCAERCDALERPLGPLPVAAGRARFEAPGRGLVTVVLR